MNLTKYGRIVVTLAAGGLFTLVMITLATRPARAAGPWYVAPGGSDGNSCLSPATPCASINGAIGKASSGDTIYVAVGTYTGTGDEVVLVDKDTTLSGGWDGTFTVQSGTSTIDGEGARRGIFVNSENCIIENFTVRNGFSDQGGGIWSSATLTLNRSTISANTSTGDAGGIWNGLGTLTLNDSTVSDNTANGSYWQSGGGGIYNHSGTLTLNNSTVSGNWASQAGGGIHDRGDLTLCSSTVSDNASDRGGGIYNADGSPVTLQNSILAGNTADSTGPDCSGAIGSSGYNLIGDTSGCTFTPGTGDLTDVDADLGLLLGPPSAPWYHPLLPGSPAIDAGNPAGCTDHLGNPLGTDQRGAPRVGRCDMGAYEYTISGPPASIDAISGTPQYALPSNALDMPLQAAVLDNIGSPVSNTLVTFFAPASGASGTFADSGTFTTTAVTDEGAVATAATFTANELEGSYTVTATVSGVVTPATFLLNNVRFYYVAPGGSDSSDCLLPTTACATINGALSKHGPAFITTILVATGTYTGTGDQVVLLDKSATLSGGWDETFTEQSGTSTIDGVGARRGITVNGGVNAIVDRFTVQNGFSGNGGGIRNDGDGTLTLNNSTISYNSGGGGISNDGTLTLNNCTVSGNTTQLDEGPFTQTTGGGILNRGGTLVLNHGTISGNTARSGGGIYNADYLGGTVTLQNTIVAGNTASGDGPDCSQTIGSSGYNLIGDTSGCTFSPGAGDLTDLSANLSPLIGSPGYHPLQSDSPAIDAVPLDQCTLATDQRGVARPQGSACDMGAYEYTAPGPAASVHAFGGTPQRTPPFGAFEAPLQALVLDNIGTPVNTVTVTFTAPASGASGTFADTGTATTTAVTDEGGMATAATFTANGSRGGYTVTATVGGVLTPADFLLTNIGWYVSPSGEDSNNCQTPTTPCATVNGALAKAGFLAGDTVLVATGTYAGTGDEVVLLNKSVRLVGGWNETFTAHSGTSTIDGEGARRGIAVNGGVTAIVERFTVQNGLVEDWSSGGGISNSGTLILNHCIVTGNRTTAGRGGGIGNGGTLILNSSAVSGNTSGFTGGGIVNTDGTLILNNSTVSGNTATNTNGGGISNDGTLTLNNSTVSGNSAHNGGGISSSDSGSATLQNTILAGNTTTWIGPDCTGSIASSGYNVIGDTTDCGFTPSPGDLLDVDPRLFILVGSPGYHPLRPGSPAIDAGNPAGCTDHQGNPLTTDQRGTPRPLDGDGDGNAICDMGAYEVDPEHPIRQLFLPIILRNH
jgi:hypothetical protein